MATSAQCRILPRAADVTGCARLDEVRHQCLYATLQGTEESSRNIMMIFIKLQHLDVTVCPLHTYIPDIDPQGKDSHADSQ